MRRIALLGAFLLAVLSSATGGILNVPRTTAAGTEEQKETL